MKVFWSKWFLLFLLATGFCRADGKMFSKIDAPPVGLPYQRAVIFHDQGKQTLFLQSMLAPGSGAIESEVAWVVPVPAMPEVGALQADRSVSTTDSIFGILTGASRPEVRRVSEVLLFVGFVLWTALNLFILFGRFGIRTRFHVIPRKVEKLILFSNLPLLLVSMATILIVGGAGAWKGISDDGLKIVADGRVGRLDYKVVLPTDPVALETWLRENGYGFAEGDRVPIAAYIKAGWHFVALRLKVAPGETLAAPDPILLRFDAPQPIYPLALTSTIGQSVEVLLHVFSSGPVDASNGMKRRFSGAVRSAGRIGSDLLYSHEPEEFFSISSWEFRLPHLTTFKETLTPERMREDIVFQPARDPTPYREKKWEW
jgi:hypothetical protein